jgi:gluconokinase
LVCLDADGVAISPIYTYADTRCAADARQLREHYDEIAVLQRTGCRIRANYLPAKIAWLKRTQPDLFDHTRTFASLSDYVMQRLFGRMRAGISVASWSGLLNRAASDWDATWLEALGISKDNLPAIAAPTAHPATMSDGEGRARGETEFLPDWRTRWPKFAHLRAHPPVGDGAAANIGSGCIDDTCIAVTIGTTAAMRVVRRRTQDKSASTVLRLASSLWSYRVDHDHELIGGATTEGGSVIAWALQTLQLTDGDAIEQAIAQMQPDAHGLTVLPTFAGERSPGYAEDIRGTIHGISLDTSATEIARALVESVAFRLAHICDALRASGMAHADAFLVGSGGALRASPTWCQIVADVCGLPLYLTDVPEATSRGVALIATGNWEKNNSHLPMTKHQLFAPDTAKHKIYRAAMARQQELYAKLV